MCHEAEHVITQMGLSQTRGTVGNLNNFVASAWSPLSQEPTPKRATTEPQKKASQPNEPGWVAMLTWVCSGRLCQRRWDTQYAPCPLDWQKKRRKNQAKTYRGWLGATRLNHAYDKVTKKCASTPGGHESRALSKPTMARAVSVLRLVNVRSQQWG